MTSKMFSVTVFAIATPLLVVSFIAMFNNPFHIFTTIVLALFVVLALFERDEDNENLFTAIRRVVGK